MIGLLAAVLAGMAFVTAPPTMYRASNRAAQAMLDRVKVASGLEPALQRYARDPYLHCDQGHVHVLDLETMEVVPLVLWPHQRELIAAWIDLEHLKETGILRLRNVHEEKSRQMGITWVTAWVVCWILHYHPTSGLALSLKGGEICDSGPTPKSFFGRVKFIWQHLPEKYQAPLHFVGQPDPQIRNLRLANAFITGGGATSDPGRGGKFGYIFMDEAARIPMGEMVHAAVARACPSGRFYNSTPAGEDDMYFRLRNPKLPEYVYLRHHWSVHPVYNREMHVAEVPAFDEQGVAQEPVVQLDADMEIAAGLCDLCKGNRQGMLWTPSTPCHRYPGKLTSPWYDLAVVELTDDQVARELDIDYTRSLTARVYPEFSEELHVIDDIPWDPLLPIEFSFDFGWSSPTAVGIWQDHPLEYRKIGEFEQGDLTPDQVVAGIKQALRRLGVPENELQDFNMLTWLAVGDPAGAATSAQTGTTLIADYRREGIAITTKPRTVDQTITAVKRLLRGRPKILLVSEKGCPETVVHFKSNRWPTDRAGRPKPDPKGPDNDRHNHMCFEAGTLVTAARGDVPIEEVRVGDEVMTRYGWRRVQGAGYTGMRSVARLATRDAEIVGTLDHPVWIAGQGWVPLGDIEAGAGQKVLVMAEVAEADVAAVAEDSPDAPSRMAVIDMELAAAAGFKGGAESTPIFSHRVVLGESDPVGGSQPPVLRDLHLVSGVGGHAQGAGAMSAPQATGGVATSGVAPRASDRYPAVLAVAGPVALPCPRFHVRHEEVVSVEHRTERDDRVPVFNLTVEGDPEFFANGILVHNCRADAYLIAHKFPPKTNTREYIEQATRSTYHERAGHLSDLPGYGDPL